MFSFINGAMMSSTQRFLTYELGRGNLAQLQKVFTTSVFIHALISLLIVLLAETLGLWFLYNKMTIPIERMHAAVWVFQMSVLATVTMVMSVPYNATIIAHEKMGAFAYISVLEVLMKLLIVYILQISPFDKLKLYAVLIFIVQLFIRIVYGKYCGKHFPESKLQRVWDRKLFKEMIQFAGWNLWGNCAGVAFTQGVNILLNMFFSPVVNAARGIAVQVQSAANQFSFNFQTALNPQIIKSYAIGDMQYMHSLIFRSSKFTFFLLLMLSMPIMLETETLLRLWLSKVPDYTVSFLKIMLCITIIDAVSNPLMVSVGATGKVKIYQSVIGGLLLMILPLSYIVLKMGGNPKSVFVVHLTVCILAFLCRLLIIRPMIKLSLKSYFRNVISYCFVVCILSLILPCLLKSCIYKCALSAFVVCLTSILSVAIISYLFGLTVNERLFVKERIRKITFKSKMEPQK